MSLFMRTFEIARRLAGFDLGFEIAHDLASSVVPGSEASKIHAYAACEAADPVFARVYAVARQHTTAGKALAFTRAFVPVFKAREARAQGIVPVESQVVPRATALRFKTEGPGLAAYAATGKANRRQLRADIERLLLIGLLSWQDKQDLYLLLKEAKG